MKIQGSWQGQMCFLILLNATVLGSWVFSLCLQAASIIALSRNLKLLHSSQPFPSSVELGRFKVFSAHFLHTLGGLEFLNRLELLRLQKQWEGVEALQ